MGGEVEKQGERGSGRRVGREGDGGRGGGGGVAARKGGGACFQLMSGWSASRDL